MTNKVVIIGTGGNSIDVIEILEEISAFGTQRYEIVGYLDDNSTLHNTIIHGYPVLGSLNMIDSLSDDISFVFTIGSPNSFKNRKSIVASLGIERNRFINVIHPSARVSRSSTLGKGLIIFPNVVICSNVVLGDFSVILSNSTINHDCTLGDFTICASNVNLAGGVLVENQCYLGAGAQIRNDVKIKSGAIVGMGSVVLNNVLENSIVIGNPGKTM